MVKDDMEFKNKVVVITGAGRGLGRTHALEFARRGARILVNDLGGAVDGTGSGNTAQRVVNEIVRLGGTAVANTASVADIDGANSIIEDAVREFGTVDIVINNAGILRDKTFANLSLANFNAVRDVHLMGAFYVTRAAWPILCQKGWGRVVFTSSGSGIFGNFGQSNYALAKMSLLGLMNVLKLEGARKGVRVNCLAPGASTRMTRGMTGRGRASLVTPAALYLCSEAAPNGVVLQASGGRFSIIEMCVNQGIDLGAQATYEELVARIDEVLDRATLAPR